MTAVIDEQIPSRAEWEALYEQAVKFKKIAPWEWMWDSNLFGVKNPEDGEIGYCCVLGAAGEVKDQEPGRSSVVTCQVITRGGRSSRHIKYFFDFFFPSLSTYPFYPLACPPSRAWHVLHCQ